MHNRTNLSPDFGDRFSLARAKRPMSGKNDEGRSVSEGQMLGDFANLCLPGHNTFPISVDRCKQAKLAFAQLVLQDVTAT